MSTPLSAAEVLNREFLEVRARILQVAAALDRLDRAGQDDMPAPADDPRLLRIRQALAALDSPSADRAEQIQMIFSREYKSTWRGDFGLTGGRHD